MKKSFCMRAFLFHCSLKLKAKVRLELRSNWSAINLEFRNFNFEFHFIVMTSNIRYFVIHLKAH